MGDEQEKPQHEAITKMAQSSKEHAGLGVHTDTDGQRFLVISRESARDINEYERLQNEARELGFGIVIAPKA